MVSFKSRFQYGISSFDYESRGFRPQGWATRKKGEKKGKKAIIQIDAARWLERGVEQQRQNSRSPRGVAKDEAQTL